MARGRTGFQPDSRGWRVGPCEARRGTRTGPPVACRVSGASRSRAEKVAGRIDRGGPRRAARPTAGECQKAEPEEGRAAREGRPTGQERGANPEAKPTRASSDAARPDAKRTRAAPGRPSSPETAPAGACGVRWAARERRKFSPHGSGIPDSPGSWPSWTAGLASAPEPVGVTTPPAIRQFHPQRGTPGESGLANARRRSTPTNP